MKQADGQTCQDLVTLNNLQSPWVALILLTNRLLLLRE